MYAPPSLCVLCAPQIVDLRRRRAYIIAQLHTTGQSIRETEAEVLSGQGVPEVRCSTIRCLALVHGRSLSKGTVGAIAI